MVKSILDGTDDIIDQRLGLDGSGAGKKPRYKHARSLQRLSEPSNKERLDDLSGLDFLNRLLEQITENWENRNDKTRKPSSENWRFSKQPGFAGRSTSLEKSLEKSIVLATNEDWANQVPVSSGLVSPQERKRAIDLVHRTKEEEFEFIELKVDEKSGGPLFAAMEILLYGLVYVFAREHMDALDYSTDDKPLLKAKNIELQVLAPAAYYVPYKTLDWLESALSRGLRERTQNLDYHLDFRFRSFPAYFSWRLWTQELLVALDNVDDVRDGNRR